MASKIAFFRCCSSLRRVHRFTPTFASSTTTPLSRLLSATSNEDWIPPKKPLAGDTAESHKYTHVEEAEELKQIEKELKELELQEKEEEKQPDWLQTRRNVIAKKDANTSSAMLPVVHHLSEEDGLVLTKSNLDDIPVKKHTLLSAKELSVCIRVMGGQNVELVLDIPQRMGGLPLGIIVVTAEQFTQRRAIADVIIQQLRRRHLQEVGVVGAEQGIDGNSDDPNETWIIVDCHNFVVHIQDEKTRKAVNLEALWSGNDDMYRIDLTDEDAIDDYVAANPVPDDYNTSLLQGGSSSSWDTTLKQLQTSQWVQQSRPKPLARRPLPKRKSKSSTPTRIKKRR